MTPIRPDGSPDTTSLARLTEFQIDHGVHGLWAMGTSAEFASFDEHERRAAIETIVRAARGRVPVIANISDASTRLAIRHARHALAAGANAIAATPPYYYPHSQDEVLAHYRSIRNAVEAPLFVYNIPQTVRVRVELATATALAEEGTVSGIKDSQNDLEWFRSLTTFVRARNLPFSAFAGTRALIDAAVLAGADGAIPSAANAFPDLCVAAFEFAARGEFDAAARFEERIIAMESIAGTASGGSRNAAVLGWLKVVLTDRGIFDGALLTTPLRTPPEQESREWLSRLAELEGALPLAT